MKILSRRSEVKKDIRIIEMLETHASRNGQPDAASRYHKRARSLKASLSAALGWITRADRAS